MSLCVAMFTYMYVYGYGCGERKQKEQKLESKMESTRKVIFFIKYNN